MPEPTAVFLIDDTGAVVSPSNPLNVGTGAPVAASIAASGTSAATPPAGTAFVTSAALAVGWYRITVLWQVTAAAETQPKNIRLSLTTGGAITDLISAAAPSLGAVTWFPPFSVVVHVVNANDTVKLAPVANGSTGAIYSATITVDQLA